MTDLWSRAYLSRHKPNSVAIVMILAVMLLFTGCGRDRADPVARIAPTSSSRSTDPAQTTAGSAGDTTATSGGRTSTSARTTASASTRQAVGSASSTSASISSTRSTKAPPTTTRRITTTTRKATATTRRVTTTTRSDPRLSVALKHPPTSQAGNVRSSPSGISCPGDCSGTFTKGSTITLIAQPDESSPIWSFSDRESPCLPSQLECSFQITGSLQVTVTFQGP
jgi:trimeric autotransporter adhesin